MAGVGAHRQEERQPHRKKTAPWRAGHRDGPLPFAILLSPPRALTIHVVHLEEEPEFLHGVAVNEQSQGLSQLLQGDGAAAV